MKQLFVLFSISYVLYNTNNLYASNDNNFYKNDYCWKPEVFDLNAHLQNLSNIHNIVWNNSSFLEHIVEILNEFKNNLYGDNSYLYAREILTRMLQDHTFKLDTISCNQYYSKIKNALLYFMNDFIYWYDKYLSNNTENEFREMVLFELSNFGYNENTNNLNEYARKCMKLYKELQYFK